MRQKIFFFLVSTLLILSFINPALSHNILELNNFKIFHLSQRKSIWPDWTLPYSFKRPGLNDDLIYPDWFEGIWNVNSKIDGELNGEPILHSAKFIYNSSGKLIADREYNTNSYALNAKNGDFLSVKNDPKSPNRQFAKLTEDRFLETKIIGRLNQKINNNIFITDELILQIFHTPDVSRVSQVETLTEFRKCGLDENIVNEISDFNICGEQFQAIYNQPGKNLISVPIKTEKFKLILSKTHYD